jgi:hypothetical protein
MVKMVNEAAWQYQLAAYTWGRCTFDIATANNKVDVAGGSHDGRAMSVRSRVCTKE